MSNHINQQRRLVLRGAAGAAALLAGGGTALAAGPANANPWAEADRIIRYFAKPLNFRKQDFVITAYGASSCDVVQAEAWISFTDRGQVSTPAPGAKDCYPAIAAAIAACHKAGGGRVLIPAGNWLCAGPIVLLSNVNVHLAAGAHVYFSNNPADYAKYGEFDCGANGKLTLSRWEGNDCLNYSPLVYARGQKNIALTGEDWTSILDGQAGLPFQGDPDCWWSWKGRVRKGIDHVPHTDGKTEVAINPINPASLAEAAPHLSAEEANRIQGGDKDFQSDVHLLRALGEARVPAEKRVFGIGHYLRPHGVQFIDCAGVLCAGYQLNHTPFWQHNPVGCRDLHAKGVFANSMGPNSDGFDPESCHRVLIEGCQFNTGDDCIAIDSGKGPDIQYGPSQDIVIQDCTMQSGHGALTLGSIMSGGIQNVYAQRLLFENKHWKTDPLSIAIRLKTNMSRGGFLRNFYVRDIKIPNGIATKPSFYKPAKGSGIPANTVASGAGAVITFDCDYDAANDTMRIRPPEVHNVHISGVVVGNVQAQGGSYSCYQPLVVLGPVAANYNGAGTPDIRPVANVTISDCDFGTPVNGKQPFYLYNARDIKLKNVKLGAQIVNQTLSS
ncbi:glycoside hydrolase family 28 protein [Massilia terrae]|uniref:Glycoside hydrolase family 28 protein n=1 Tax=Massilia terrae TaxID=1811224 RepID=A0ABT2CVB4_9BURK|nr:glycoside hydrolase family 28 protein [Massilia terrae]MCS0657784.1 glycoside hydrolase family 28 protein [Massilia terrae]